MGIHTIHAAIATYIDDIPDVALTNVIIITGKRIVNMLNNCRLRLLKLETTPCSGNYGVRGNSPDEGTVEIKV